ncbi:MAG: D-sedoheptulose 7-phosphate isomerase [Candidatus Kaelpia aquatica]|nr:D-sedoheptulose 7-phosphate isomerase [Candidatus Kaelpia aquatica]
MKDLIESYFKESIEVKESFFRDNIDKIEEAAEKLINAFKDRKKLIIFGNGGSASDSQHITAELIGRFRKDRKALPVISLASNTASLTALANDYGYKYVFKRQLEAFYEQGDVVIAISTSGSSLNVVEALEFLRHNNGYVISFTGGDGGEMKKLSDLNLIVPSTKTSIVQEVHITLAHLLCLLIEEGLF